MFKRLFTLVAIATMLCCGKTFAQDITVTFNPESGSVLSEISGFSTTFSADMELDSNGGFVFRDGIMVQTTVTAAVSEDKRTVTFTISPTLTAPGEYTFKYFDWLVRPVSGGFTPEINPVYTIEETTGIEAPQGDKASGKVYNLNGVELKDANTKGINIINGKKVLVK